MKNRLFLILLILMLSGCQEADNPLRGFDPGYHIRTSLMNYFWVNGPRNYIFANVPVLCGYIRELPQKDLIQKWLDNAPLKISFEYRIFQTVDKAELYMTERLDLTTLWYYNIIEFPLSGGQLGDNCFHQITSGVIMFIRNNVWVTVWSYSNDHTDAVEQIARSIDSLIVAAPKVYRPDMVPAPKIKSIEMLPPYPKDWGESTLVKVEASDTKSDTIRFRVVGHGYSLDEIDGLHSFTPDSIYPKYQTGNPNTFRFMAWVWNEDNIVALADKEFAFDK